MKHLWKIILQWLKHGAPKAISTVQQPTQEPQTLWPAYSCPSFAKHGYEGESQFRTDAMRAAQAGGLDAIAIKFIPNQPPARIEIYEWESDKDKGKFRPNCARQAREYGITKWVVDIAGVDLGLVADTFKAYSEDGIRVQYTGVKITKDVMKTLECDINGIKTSPRRLRQ
jgi:hypothetical protein